MQGSSIYIICSCLDPVSASGGTLVAKVANRSNSCLDRLLLRGNCRMRNVVHHASAVGASHVSRLCRSPRDTATHLFLRCNSLASNAALHHVLRRIGPSRVCGLKTRSRIQIDFSSPRCATSTINVNALHLLRTVHSCHDHANVRIHCCRTKSSRVCNRIRTMPRDRAAPFCPHDPCTYTGICTR